MPTDSFYPPERPAARQGLFAAVLQTHDPVRCFITTERGDEVKISLAGYRLKFGHTYYVCAEGDLTELRLVGFPSLLVRRHDSGERTKHGRAFKYVQIRVGPTGWSRFTHFGAYPRDLELEVHLADGGLQTAILPVVLERSLSLRLLLFFVFFAFLIYAFEIILEAFQESLRSVDFAKSHRVFTNPSRWVLPFLLALLAPISRCITRFAVLFGRAHELKQRFLQEWSRRSTSPEDGNSGPR